MARLKVKNVGPIKGGFEEGEGFIEFKGISLFLGNQGSGKSTIAKLFSTLTWIEKALVRGDFTMAFVMKYNRFKNKHLAYQNISNYLTEDSFIHFEGDAFRMIFSNNQFSVEELNNGISYRFPKIMYVPAERNFVSSVDRPDLIKRLPLPLYTFMDEYEEAKQNLEQALDLPIANTRFEYKRQSRKAILIGENYEVNLLEASSGFQSLVPLVLVTHHLSKIVNSKGSIGVSRKDINREDEEKIRRTISKLFEDSSISEEVLKAALEKLSARFMYESFINVVEEPEQNLYPSTQRFVVNDLIKYKNQNPNNRLIITTHSPYILNWLTLAVKASSFKVDSVSKQDKSRINEIVPLESVVDPTDVVIYQMDSRNGSIVKLPDYKGLPSDENFLNASLEEFNNLFIQLLEIDK